MPSLEIRELVFEAGGKRIIDGLDLAIAAGEVHALLGTNGTGKSTLAYLIMGCEGYRPASGEIVWGGRVMNALRVHERAALGISMAWQEPVRFEGIRVREYLALKGGDGGQAGYLELVGLEPSLYLDRMVDGSLSGGERKRIELASVLSLDLGLAVLDEPDSGIDMLSIEDVINVINAFREKGVSVLLITHREEIARIADRASLLCAGRIVCQGEPGKVAEYYKSRKCLICDGRVCVYV